MNKYKSLNSIVNHFLPLYLERLEVQSSKATIQKVSAELNLLKRIVYKQNITLDQKDFLKLRDLIMEQRNKSGQLLVITSRLHLLRRVKLFLSFCSEQKGLKNKIKEEFLYQLQPTKQQINEKRTYEVQRNKPPNAEEVNKLLEVDLGNPDITERARAIIISLAFAGIRHGSLKSLPIKCLVTEGREYPYFNLSRAENVAVKMGKNLKPGFLVPKKEYYTCLINYKQKLLDMGFSPNDALFGKTKPQRDENKNFNRKETILSNEFISGTSAINKMLKEMCQKANLNEVYTAHSFRHFFAGYAKNFVKTIREFQALAKSTGHNNLDQLYSGYGRITQEESLDILLDVQNKIFLKEETTNFESDIIIALSLYYGEQYAMKLKQMCDSSVQIFS